MTRWKRSLIWLGTFLFGLYYIVDFFLPAEIGGALDKSGMGAASAASTPGGVFVYYTALAGPRKPDGTPDDKLLSYRIMRFPLSNPTQRQVVVAPSPLEKADYFGCKNPCVLLDGSVWRMWYVGLGFDDRRARILYRESVDGTRWGPPQVAIDEPRRLAAGAPEWLAGGISSFRVRKDGAGFSMVFVAKGADGDRVGMGRASDPATWRLEGDPGNYGLGKRPLDTVAYAGNALVAAGGGKALVKREGSEPVAVEGVSANAADVVRSGGEWLLFATTLGDGKRQELSVYHSADLLHWTAMNGVRPGKPGIQTLPLPITTIANWVNIVTAFAVGIGLIGLLRVHLARIGRRQKGSFDSLALVVSMVAIFVSVVLFRLLPGDAEPTYKLWVERSYDLLWANMQVPLGASTFALLAAFLVSAAYRAFRIRGRDATVLAVSAVIVLLSQVPVGDLLTAWMPPSWQEHVGIQSLRQWYLEMANSAVQRGIAFGIFVGSVAMAIRIWLSLDRVGTESS